jgi:hypothetical protein
VLGRIACAHLHADVMGLGFGGRFEEIVVGHERDSSSRIPELGWERVR